MTGPNIESDLDPADDASAPALPSAGDDTPLAALPARERILRTAHDLFYREGVRATGIDRVIAESGVTKVTFYRHFPSKNDLVLAYLDLRHLRWMAWFTGSLARHGGAPAGVDALVGAMGEWFRSEGFRGCAFLNGVSEIGPALPEAVDITRRHKADMTDAIAALLPAGRQRKRQAAALALAVDGAIVQAQFGETPDAALRQLSWIGERIVTAGD